MEQLSVESIWEKVERNLPRNESVVERTSGPCEWTGKYNFCSGCDGVTETSDCFYRLGENYQ